MISRKVLRASSRNSKAAFEAHMKKLKICPSLWQDEFFTWRAAVRWAHKNPVGFPQKIN